MFRVLKFSCQLVSLVTMMAAIGCGEDITIPMDGGGNIVIRNPHFITVDQFNIHKPELTFNLVNNATMPWTALTLHFDMGGFCGDEVRQWSVSVSVSPATEWSIKWYKQNVESLVLKLQGCWTEIIKARIGEGADGPNLSTEEIVEHRAKREAEAAEQKRIATEERERNAEEQAKRDAAEAARRKRLAAEQKKKQAEADARYAKIKAEEDAKAAEERRKIRAACSVVYQNTADKKVGDLTVREEQQVRTCQALGLYPPQ